MTITPQTNLRLLNIPLSIDNKNQLSFNGGKDEQYAYFNSLVHLEVDKFSYQRKDSTIRYPGHIDTLLKFNYCMYQNSNYSDKWFYCYITNMRYLNDNCTEISIKTDVFQTWFYDSRMKLSFVEREMINVADDVPGANLLPEGLEFGELTVGGTAEFDELEPIYVIAFTDTDIGKIPTPQEGYSYNGIASSVTFILCYTITGLQSVLDVININQKGDKILTVFSIPKLAVLDLINTTDFYKVLSQNFMQTPLIKTLISTPTQLDGYTPRNQKLRTYPYLYLGFNPSNGSSKIYRYEDFKNGTPVFKIISEINPNPLVVFLPQNYRGSIGDSLADLSSLNGYPTISYKNDVFNSWLAKNSEIITLDRKQEDLNYKVNTVSSISNGLDYSSLISSSINTGLGLAQNMVQHDLNIQRQLAQVEAQSLLPNEATLSSNNSTLLGYNLIDKNIFTRYSIKKQFAKRIDKFFDMFGYLTNELKVPNTNNRPNWNYIKTIGMNMEGDIPQEDLAELKSLFDNGFTIWHNPETFLDYSQNNR